MIFYLNQVIKGFYSFKQRQRWGQLLSVLLILNGFGFTGSYEKPPWYSLQMHSNQYILKCEHLSDSEDSDLEENSDSERLETQTGVDVKICVSV